MPVTITQSHIRVAQDLADNYQCKAEIRVCRENETMAGGRVIVRRPSESRWAYGCYTVTVATLDPMGNLHIEYPEQVLVEPAPGLYSPDCAFALAARDASPCPKCGMPNSPGHHCTTGGAA